MLFSDVPRPREGLVRSLGQNWVRRRWLAAAGKARGRRESVGSVPTDLYDSISRLHAVGALGAAGFVPVDVDGPDDEAPGALDPPGA